MRSSAGDLGVASRHHGSRMPTLRFWRDYDARVVPGGTTLMAAAQRAGAPLGNACRSQGVCRACAVLVLAGEQHLADASELERRMNLEPGWRMACQTRLASDDSEATVTIWIPAWGGWPECSDSL
jgi:ferredoxin